MMTGPPHVLAGKNFKVLKNCLKLPTPATKVMVDYIWIGGTGMDLRNKTRVLDNTSQNGLKLSDIPDWSFDGSSTGQAQGHDSEIILKPVKIVPDPFRGGQHLLALCECLDPKFNPIPTNRRAYAREIFETKKVQESETWFGLEQEYTLFTGDGLRVLGFPEHGSPGPQGPYYCAPGTENAFGRHIGEAHLFACLYSGLDIGGTNAEVMPGSWEYQIGVAKGIDAADQLWIARFIMQRLAEEFCVQVSLDPKPLRDGDWNGAGCHTNFSTKQMRSEGGLDHIFKAMKNLEQCHKKHMDLYGKDNHFRMTGIHETANFNEFSWGIANRGCSVRVTRKTELDKKGFFEDRRPSAGCDPYNVTGVLCDTILLENK